MGRVLGEAEVLSSPFGFRHHALVQTWADSACEPCLAAQEQFRSKYHSRSSRQPRGVHGVHLRYPEHLAAHPVRTQYISILESSLRFA